MGSSWGPSRLIIISSMSLNFEFKEEGLMSRLGRLKVSPKNRANDV